MIELKNLIYSELIRIQNEKIAQLEANLRGLFDDLSSESKNSSGDKHETGRAMIQLEQEQSGKQLQEAINQKSLLLKTEINTGKDFITNGSLIYTGKHWYFICSVPAKLELASKTIFCISLHSPIGKLLNGKKEADKLVFNGQNINIINIY